MSQDLFSCLKSFLAVAEDKSFAIAARRLKISSPVITKQIKWLEHYLKKRLFERTTRYVRLTEAGELYLEYAYKILTEEKTAKAALHNIDSEPHGQITIGLPVKLNAICIAENIAQFLRLYPKIKCRIISDHTSGAVISNHADIVINPLKIIDNQLVRKCLFTSMTGIFASPFYLEKYGIPKNLTELRHHNCLVNLSITPNRIWKFDTGEKIKICGNYESDIGANVTTAAIYGIGLGNLVKDLTQKEIDEGQLIEIDIGSKPLPVTLYIYHRPVPSCSIVHLFVNYLLENIGHCG